MPKKKTGILRHIADIISQNKTLSHENETLNNQNERLALEVERYKELFAKIGKSEPINRIIPEKKRSLLRYKTATVLFADAIGFEQFSLHTDPKTFVDSLDEIFIKLQHIITKFPVRNIRTIGDTLMCVGGTSPILLKYCWQLLKCNTI
jgi:class 3 adenylate cyclase